METTTSNAHEQPTAQVHPNAAKTAIWRTLVFRMLIVLFGVVSALAMLAGWVRLSVLDTETYVERVAPLATNPDVQEALIQQVVVHLVDNPRIAPLLASGALSEQDIENATRLVVTSDTFADIWREENRIAHPRIVAALTGKEIDGVQTAGGRVIVNMDAVARAVEDHLGASGFEINLDSVLEDTPTTITVFASDDLEKAQRWVSLFDRVALTLPFAAAGVLISSLMIHESRSIAFRGAGIALAVGMGVTLALFSIGRWLYLDGLARDAPTQSAEAFFDMLTRTFWQSSIALLLVGVTVAAVSIFVGNDHEK